MKLFQSIKINQWKNTVSAIKLFNSLKYKHLMKFFMFDIRDFYTCITQDLLNKALNFASEYTYVYIYIYIYIYIFRNVILIL